MAGIASSFDVAGTKHRRCSTGEEIGSNICSNTQIEPNPK
jgi:hypothetical protein